MAKKKRQWDARSTYQAVIKALAALAFARALPAENRQVIYKAAAESLRD